MKVDFYGYLELLLKSKGLSFWQYSMYDHANIDDAY